MVDGADAEGLRVLRRGGADRLAAEQHLATVGREHTRQHLDERGFAGAVLPHQGVHFTRKKPQADVVQGTHAEELFGDAAEPQQRLRAIVVGMFSVDHGRRCQALFLLYTSMNTAASSTNPLITCW